MQSTAIEESLQLYGAVIVAGVPGLQQANRRALQSLSDCGSSGFQGFHHKRLLDNSERWTLAGNDSVSFPPEAIEQRCPSIERDIIPLRDIVEGTGERFVRATDPTFRTLGTAQQHGGFEALINQGRSLEHFHLYNPAAKNSTQNSVPFHTDSGAFLVASRALSFGSATDAVDDLDFVVQRQDGSSLHPRLQEDEVIILMGSAMRSFLGASVHVPTHAVNLQHVPAGNLRAWHGRMYLFPDESRNMLGETARSHFMNTSGTNQHEQHPPNAAVARWLSGLRADCYTDPVICWMQKSTETTTQSPEDHSDHMAGGHHETDNHSMPGMMPGMADMPGMPMAGSTTATQEVTSTTTTTTTLAPVRVSASYISDDGWGPLAAGSEAKLAWDGNPSTSYESHAATGSFTAADLGAPVRIVQLAFVAGTSHHMTGGQFEGTNDLRGTWKTLYTLRRSPQANPTLNYVKVTDGTPFRYVRYVSPVNAHCNIAEIQVYTHVTTTTTTLPHEFLMTGNTCMPSLNDWVFTLAGKTASGAPFYSSHDTYYMYYDPSCDGTVGPRWILDMEAPLLTAESQLNSLGTCHYLAGLSVAAGAALPMGTTKWSMYCGAGTFGTEDLTLVLRGAAGVGSTKGASSGSKRHSPDSILIYLIIGVVVLAVLLVVVLVAWVCRRCRRHRAHPESVKESDAPDIDLEQAEGGPFQILPTILHSKPNAEPATKPDSRGEEETRHSDSNECVAAGCGSDAEAMIPSDWAHRDLSCRFESMKVLSNDQADELQKALDGTFQAIRTRDRTSEMPGRLILKSALRIEHSEMWKRYVHRRQCISRKRPGGCTPLAAMGGPAKTDGIGSQSVDGSINEVLLWHGTSPSGALGIFKNGFQLDMAGSSFGTMYGKGAYFAECSSKSDEYARDDSEGIYQNLYCLLLCRVTLGETLHMTTGGEATHGIIDAAMSSGAYESVLGDRQASVGTYREFVVYNESQIYPQYLLIYSHHFESAETLDAPSGLAVNDNRLSMCTASTATDGAAHAAGPAAEEDSRLRSVDKSSAESGVGVPDMPMQSYPASLRVPITADAPDRPASLSEDDLPAMQMAVTIDFSPCVDSDAA